MTRLRPLLAAALLLVPALGLADERTGVIDARGTRVELPLPEGYVQASLDMPEWVALSQTFAPPQARVEEVVLHAECFSDPDAMFCPAAYEVMSLPATLPRAKWRALRSEMIEQLGGDTRAMQERAIERSRERFEEGTGGSARFSRDTSANVVLVALDDPRSVRFYLPAPGRIEAEGVKAEQLRVVAQFVVEGQLMIVAISRDFPEGKATPEAHQALVAELDAFLARLYALNPEYAAAPAE